MNDPKKLNKLIRLKLLTRAKIKIGLIRKIIKPNIVSVNNTYFQDDSLVSIDSDTNIILDLPVKAKCIKLVSSILSETENAQTQVYHQAENSEFTEERSIKFKTNQVNISYLVSSKPIKSIRLDAIDTDGRFDIEHFCIIRISKIEYALTQKFNTIKKIRQHIKNNPSLVNKFFLHLHRNGLKKTINLVKNKLLQTENKDSEKYHYLEPKITPAINKEINDFKNKPLISIIMPVYNIDPKWLEKAIKSVEKQWYKNWELCIADDRSTNRKTIALLKALKNPKIKIKFLSKNLNISGASNKALELAAGDYIALLDNDDEITPDALYEVVKKINATGADFIYSDEDKIDIDGNFTHPYFKPDYSYDLLLSLNYICHFSVIKKEILDKVGGFNSEYNGAQDYDLFLRVVEQAKVIEHIPKILYHWRMIETSTALSGLSKPYAHEAGKKSIQAHFNRQGIAAKATDSEYDFVFDVEYEMPNVLVSIIIPTKDGLHYLKTCIKSIVESSTYENYEILILNNNSEEKETFAYFDEIQRKHPLIRVIDCSYEFNWSRLNNNGIELAKGEVFIFLNNDTKVITPNWIERLASRALQPNVGSVGALLLFEDDTIQHAGVILGLNGWADHLFRGAPQYHGHINHTSPMVSKNVLASTGACLAISKNVIEKIGNFDDNFIICGSDVEISLRAYEAGYRNILDANTKLYHFESKTRDSYIPECDFERSKKVYQCYLDNGDPFYNQNLSLKGLLPKVKKNDES